MGTAQTRPPPLVIQRHSPQRFHQAITWADLPWLRSRTTLPILLKGVLTAEDARLAAEHGVDGLAVSNHGGRQLDGAVPSLAALPEVVAAVPAAVPVLVDGGPAPARTCSRRWRWAPGPC